MKEIKVGIIMNGVTGRMGTNQHLLRSIAEIIKQGGVKIGPGETIMPDPVLVGRDENKLQRLCSLSGIKKMTTDLDSVLADPSNIIYFDAQTTTRRADAVKKAAKAGKKTLSGPPSFDERLYKLHNFHDQINDSYPIQYISDANRKPSK